MKVVAWSRQSLAMLKARSFSLRNPLVHKSLLAVFLVSIVVMTIYEMLKQFVWPDIGIWESHIITIIFTSVLATVCSYFVELHLQRVKEKSDRERLDVFRATMHKVTDILGNFMNNMLYFKEEIESLNEHDQQLYGKVVKEHSDRIRELGDLENVTIDEIRKH